MTWFYGLFVSLNFYALRVSTYEILGIFTNQGGSHFRVFGPVMRQLAEMGHNVTVLSYPRVEDPPVNYKHIPLSKSDAVTDAIPFDWHDSNIVTRQIFEANILCELGLDACREILENEESIKILNDLRRFDVVITELFNTECGEVFQEKLKVPLIAFTSSYLFPWMYARAGVPINPSFMPIHSLSYGRRPDFRERVFSTLSIIHNIVAYRLCQWRTLSVIRRFVNSINCLDSLSKNVSLVLMNSHPVLLGADPLPPNVINVGGLHVHEPREVLPNDLEKFISDAVHGVIYVSFGSMVRATSMPQDKLKAFLDAFAEIPQKVLWKWENDSLPGAPPNLFIKKWMPQLDILSHSNVKAFISHGGMLGTTEAIHTGVPMLTIPLFGDQFANSAAVKESGLGLTVQYEDITKENILNALRQLLEPKKYAEAKRLSQIWHDRPMSPMDTAIYWIEYVARHGGAPHLRSAAIDLPLYQYLLLDVIAFLGLISFIILYINYRILKFLVILCCTTRKSDGAPEKLKSKKPKKE